MFQKLLLYLTNKFKITIMEMKASMVVMSHLSDAQEITRVSPAILRDIYGEQANEHIDFAKYIILKCNGDLTKEIDPDKLYKDFLEKFAKK